MRPRSFGDWVAIVGFLLAALAAYYDLRERVHIIEIKQDYSHGDLSPFIKGAK
jgi:hypothetical protein